MSQTDSHCFGNAAECSTLQVHNLYNFMTRCTNWADIIPYPTSPACPACPSSLPFTSSTYIRHEAKHSFHCCCCFWNWIIYIHIFLCCLSPSVFLTPSLALQVAIKSCRKMRPFLIIAEHKTWEVALSRVTISVLFYLRPVPHLTPSLPATPPLKRGQFLQGGAIKGQVRATTIKTAQ